MASSKSNGTFQDGLQYFTKYVKYWKTAVLLFMLGVSASAAYFTYGKPSFYSRSLVTFSDMQMPIQSETSDVQGTGRYARLAFILHSSLRSRWLMEQTANRLGLVDELGQFEFIRENYISKVDISLLPGNIFQIEIYAYEPWLVKVWPEAMLAAYTEYTLKQRARHREAAIENYTAEMERLKGQIKSERNATAKFEEDNHLTEQFINNNSLESVPSEMLTLKNRIESMEQVLSLSHRGNLKPDAQLSILKKFRGMPVPVGTVMRKTSPDPLISGSNSTPGGTIAALSSDAPQASVAQSQPAKPGQPGAAPQVIVVPSMVEELEPWEITERDLRSAMKEREHLAQTLLPGHELMRNLDKKISQLEASIQEELQVALNSFKLEKEHLSERFEELQRQMPNYRKVLNDYENFKQDYSLATSGQIVWEEAYARLKNKLAAMEYTGIDMHANLDFQGFTMMRDKDPVTPSKRTLLLYGLGLGSALAGGTCFGLQKFRATTSLVTDTEQTTGLNSVGVLPLSKSDQDFKRLFCGEHAETELGYDVRESFRIMRCSLPLHVARDNPCQVIMVTSARPGEGKTVISSLLARSFAEAGLRTVLVDADLRRGRINDLIPAGESNPGLRGILAGEVKNFRDAIVEAPGLALSVMVRGGYSAAAVNALGGMKFNELVGWLRDQYDRVIIDTPPVLGLADPLMIAPATDGILLVVRSDKTTKRDVQTGIEYIVPTKVPIFGFVLNGVDLTKLENYYYYSSYYPKYYDPSYLNTSAA